VNKINNVILITVLYLQIS